MTRAIVVTGAASGIGRALTELLRSQGNSVITADLRDADLNVDLTTAAGRNALVAGATERSNGRLDAVVAVAGIAAPIPAAVAVNYFGAVATLDGLRPLLAASDAPRAAVVSSLAVLEDEDAPLLEALLAGDEPRAMARAEEIHAAATDHGIYGAQNSIYITSKIAIARWVRDQAPTNEWAGASIPLNAIAPGTVETPMTAELLASEEGRAALRVGAPSPLNGPAASPSAPAHLLAWLVSDANTNVTGQLVFIDGGAEAIRRPDRV